MLHQSFKGAMSDEDRKQTMRDIEETQDRLRDSIEQVKRLATQSQQLLDKHKKELEGGAEA
jgi:F0F1-type ATP synthase membrane subunit b/b'